MKNIPCGVAMAIVNMKGELLVLDHVKHNKLSFPGGKVEQGETLLEAIMRELEEEVGITSVDILREQEVWIENPSMRFYVFLGITDQTPVNNEPHKHRSLQWIANARENLEGKTNLITETTLAVFNLTKHW